MTSCDNGNADVVLRDSPPVVTLSGVSGTIEQGNPIEFGAKLVDGTTPETSKSPLASYSYVLADTASFEEYGEGGGTTTGRMDSIAVSISTDEVPVGVYYLYFRATDVADLTTEVENIVTIIEEFESIGIIGSATPGGWDTDTDMTKNGDNPCLWEISDIVLTAGEAKFRANNDWGVNWGDTAFPAGTGTQDGSNIPVTAGTYSVSINACTGAYTFTETE